MTPLVLGFPPTGGGSDDGFNHPGIETFQGNIGRFIARESAQNTIDAAAGGEVHLAFELVDLPVVEIPAVDQLLDVLDKCAVYFPSNPQAVEFAGNASALLHAPTIPALKISDYGTTGLTGTDTGRDSAWYALVRSAGVSNKQAGQGGSYGIGKYAPFAASSLRTVAYSTMVHDTNEVAFQGVSVLWSHSSDGGRTMQGTGYIGHHDMDAEVFRAARIGDDIPPAFRRDRPGTDVWILGYRDADSETWQRDLRSSILKNFWPAIRRGTIRFTVGDTEIDSGNLAAAMEEFSAEPEFLSYQYYLAATSPQALTFEREFDMIGLVTLRLLPDGEALPKRVAFARKAGMIIEDRHFRCRRSYAGFMECLNDEGNQFLRAMEPPRHDCLDMERLPKYKGHRQAFRALLEWIRECVRNLNPIATDKAMDVPELARYLPDEGDEEQEAVTADAAESEDTDFAARSPEGAITVTPARAVSPARERVSGASGEEGEDGGEGGGGGTPDPGDHKSKRKGGRNERGGTGGQDSRDIPDPLPELVVRAMSTSTNSYDLILRADDDFEGSVHVFAVGEDGGRETVQIDTATTAVGDHEVANGTVKGISLDPDTPLRVKIVLKSNDRLALHCELER